MRDEDEYLLNPKTEMLRKIMTYSIVCTHLKSNAPSLIFNHYGPPINVLFVFIILLIIGGAGILQHNDAGCFVEVVVINASRTRSSTR